MTKLSIVGENDKLEISAPSVNPEHEKKFLPSLECDFPELGEGARILQFYFPSSQIITSGNSLYYQGEKKPFLTLGQADLTMVKTFLSAPKKPKARIRLTEKHGVHQAYFTMKLDQRVSPDQNLNLNLPEDQRVIRNLEFEVPVEYALAEHLYNRFGRQSQNIIAKTRYEIKHTIASGGKTVRPYAKPFEIDFFMGPDHFRPRDKRIADNSGVVIIELELSQDEEFNRLHVPHWVGQDITHDKRFTNSKLSQRPYASWPKKERPEILRRLYP